MSRLPAGLSFVIVHNRAAFGSRLQDCHIDEI
jgi:hypothetical protein